MIRFERKAEGLEMSIGGRYPGRGLALAVALIAGWSDLAGAAAANLTVRIENVRNDAGALRIGIWNQSEGFTEEDHRVAGADLAASDGANGFVFEDLAPGRYAVIAFHDENDNGEFDLTLVGLPGEGLGFSNGAWITVLGPHRSRKRRSSSAPTAARRWLRCGIDGTFDTSARGGDFICWGP